MQEKMRLSGLSCWNRCIKRFIEEGWSSGLSVCGLSLSRQVNVVGIGCSCLEDEWALESESFERAHVGEIPTSSSNSLLSSLQYPSQVFLHKHDLFFYKIINL